MRNPTRSKPKEDDTIYISEVASEVLAALKATDGTSVMAAKYLERTTNSVAGIIRTLSLKGLVVKTGQVIKTPEYPKGADVYKRTGLQYKIKKSLGRRRACKKTVVRPKGEPLMYQCVDFYIYPPNYQRML